MKNIFIDGNAGTTGLRINERLKDRNDIKLLTLPDEKRKDPQARKEMLNSCDIAFLCLPDDAARESVSLIENPSVRVLDTSTAHRTNPDWAYGFPELSAAHREKILNSNRIAVPGCHASGFIALVYPLIESGIISPDALLTCHSLTGYSGGGKKMIAEYESDERSEIYDSPRQYGLSQQHKHLKEMKAVTGINNPPAFCPIVADYYSGMLVTVPIFSQYLQNGAGIDDIRKIYFDKYNGNIVKYKVGPNENGFICSNKLSFNDTMEIYVEGNCDRILLMARYDNLGKGASGAAIQNLNLIMGVEETTGLVTELK
ncbi:MAG: N-acetyl-gamma-glutamyl-phosphate reductase [Clostridia bacterium]|nr:N-acetyl-gamma-glutamyl-phosphate reductase [Clostridia bacterium]